MKAPPFTVENAAEMGRRSVAARVARAKLAKEELERARIALERERLSVAQTPEEARRIVTLHQLDRLDKMINAALDDDDAELFLQLTAAKERLWKLVTPTAGTHKPRAAKPGNLRQSYAEPLPEPARIEPTKEPTSTPTPQHIDIAPQPSEPTA